MVPLSHLYITTGKTIALPICTFVGKVMSLLFIVLSGFVGSPRNAMWVPGIIAEEETRGLGWRRDHCPGRRVGNDDSRTPGSLTGLGEGPLRGELLSLAGLCHAQSGRPC